MQFRAPAPRFIGPAAHHSAGANKPIKRIVIHSTVSPCREGQARETAAYFRSSKAGGSAHYIVDPGEIIQSVADGVIAWHAPPNGHSLGIELCEYPSMVLGRWDDAAHVAMFGRATQLVAELCLAYDVRPWYVPAAGLRAGLGGITTHRQVSLAFRQSSHWDPGEWPRVKFMREVRRKIKALKAGAQPMARVE